MKAPNNNKYVLFGGSFVLANKLQAVADKQVGGLRLRQWFLLRNLKDMPLNPPPTISQLAAEADTTRQNTARMLTLLEKQGYVELLADENDARSRRVKLSGSGWHALKSQREQAQPFLEKLYDGISDEECAAAAAVLKKLVANLEKMEETK